jgi:inorganic phosphate transporter, PiT family
MTGSFLFLLVGLALLFGFVNGFRNAATSTATAVSTGVMRPHEAVTWIAASNFLAVFLFPMTVAATVASGIVDPALVDHRVVLAALLGALTTCGVAWRFGLPASLAHALVGALAGAAVAHGGAAALFVPGLLAVALLVVAAPLIALVIGSLLVVVVSRTAFRSAPRRVDRRFRRLQRVSTVLFGLGQGANDAQKTVGLLWLIAWLAGTAGPSGPPDWAIWWGFVALALGALVGGWYTVRAMGQKLTRLKPVGGVCADTGAALVLGAATLVGIPISSNHALTGGIAGVGATYRASSVRWGRVSSLAWALVVTLPAAAIAAALASWALRLLT